MWHRPGAAPIHCSIIIAVLESYDVVVRQCAHLAAIVPDDWELILLDDGSMPPIPLPTKIPRNFSLVATRNMAPWTQPIARNLGARLARGRFLLLTDIDHILTGEAISAVHSFAGSRMFFPRSSAVLDEAGHILRDGFRDQDASSSTGQGPENIHQNTFAIRRELFLDDMSGGYDESLCAGGRYGGDDVEFNRRYSGLIRSGRAESDILGPMIFVYPDPATSEHFHSLPRS